MNQSGFVLLIFPHTYTQVHTLTHTHTYTRVHTLTLAHTHIHTGYTWLVRPKIMCVF